MLSWGEIVGCGESFASPDEAEEAFEGLEEVDRCSSSRLREELSDRRGTRRC